MFVVFALCQFSHFYSVLESDPQFGFEEARRKLQGMDTVCSVALCLALQKLSSRSDGAVLVAMWPCCSGDEMR